MKRATGKYIKVRALTRKQAIKLAPKIFAGDTGKLWAEGKKLWAEGKKIRAEGDKLWAEGYKLRAEIAIKYKGYTPDYIRGINFIAKDLPDHVYCFVWPHEEIWVYDGENCPNRNEVEKVDWGGTP